ncbi:hypothetical protein [Magnetospirillum molischianum]|uniref:Uncharacterized protein n=1 Tax=Magnetospirillum molischianum DSM 120 TaxID=1150626 RepID=H8FX59_MAGML|nr:hypothetical protein [Magnetospirillum molischianum]CCG42947.1 conserved exported hypothetical protein [Magnetospirillum molischianum DSM 120]
MFRFVAVPALAILGLLAAAPVLAQSSPAPAQEAVQPTERLVMIPPEGWQNGGSSASRTAIATHLFPPGQNSENWTEMLTIQVIVDPRAEARAFVQRVVDASRSGCDAAGPSPASEGMTNNYPVATLTVTCTRGHQSGMGGLVAVKAIRGQQALFVVERLWRGPAFARDDSAPIPKSTLQEWSTFLRGVSLCDHADPIRHPCPR